MNDKEQIEKAFKNAGHDIEVLGVLPKSNEVFTSPDFNNGICKETCNCIEIAEKRNVGNSVKGYPCLNGNAKQELTKPFNPTQTKG